VKNIGLNLRLRLYYGLRVCEKNTLLLLCDRLRKGCTTVE